MEWNELSYRKYYNNNRNDEVEYINTYTEVDNIIDYKIERYGLYEDLYKSVTFSVDDIFYLIYEK